MGPNWERTASPPDDAPLYLDAVLKPHRSLSPKAFRWMLMAVISVNLAMAAWCAAHRAFPVAGFCGLDVAALYWAFRMNYRAARIEEHVQVAREHIHIARRDVKGATTHWVVSPMWARATQENDGVTIRSAGRGLRIAAFLAPAERRKFMRALDEALWRAKKGGAV